MNAVLRASFVAVLLTSLFCISVLAADAAKPGDLSGKVVDQAAQPIANAEVVLYRFDGAHLEASKVVASTKSAADGTFAFPAALTWPSESAARGSWHFILGRDVEHGVGFTALAATDATADVAVRLTGKQVVKVNVTTPDGKPAAGASVYLGSCVPKASGSQSRPLWLQSDVGVFSATTDAAGQAELIVPPDCLYRLIALKPGYAKSPGTDRITLLPGGTITGTVTLSDGKPAAGVRVTYAYNAPTGRNDATTQTDNKGHYELRDVAAQTTTDNDADPFGGVASVTAEESTLDIPSTISANVSVKPGETLTRNLVLQKNLELSGVVVDDAGNKPLPGMSMYLNSWGQPGMSANRALVTDDQGRFRTGVLRGANVQLSFRPSPNSKYLLDEQQMMNSVQTFQNVISDRKDLVLRVKLIPTRTITGKVIGATGAPVVARIYSDPRVPAISSAADGTFTLATAPADRPFGLLAMAGEQGGVVFVKPEQQQITVQLQPTVERDVLATTASGKLVADLTLSGFPISDGTMWYQAAIGAVPTDAAGKAHLKHLVPGITYQVNWNGQGNASSYGSGNARIDLALLKPEEPLRITVRQYANTLAGKVVNSKDEPVANAQFELRSQQAVSLQHMQTFYTTRTGADGNFKFDQLADGNLDVVIYAPNYRRYLVSLPTNKPDARIVLHTQQEPARHEVTVCDADGKPMADIPLIVVFREQNAQQPSQEAMNTDANGTVDLSDLPAGDLTVICDQNEYAIAGVSMQSYEEGQYRITLTKALPPRQVRLVDDAGKPIAGLDVRVNSFSAPSSGDGYGPNPNNFAQLYNWPKELLTATGMVQKTDAQGRALFPRISHNQQMSLQIQSQVFGNQSKDVQPSLADAVTEVRVSVPGSVTGKVTIKGNPVVALAKLRVSLRPNQAGRIYDGQLRPDGSYSISGVVPGGFTAGVMTWDRDPVLRKYKLRGDHAVTVEPGKSVQLDLELTEGIAIRGHFDYTPVPNATGRARIAIQEPGSPYMLDTDVDANGNFEAYVSEPGTFTPMYLLPGSNQWENTAPITVTDEKPLEGVTIKARPAKGN